MTRQKQDGFNVKGLLPSAESFDEVFDDLVLNTCQALEAVDKKITSENATRPPLDVGIGEALEIRRTEREARENARAERRALEKAEAARQEEKQSALEMNEKERQRRFEMTKEERRMRDYHKQALATRGMNKGGAEPQGEKKDDYELYKAELAEANPDLELESVPSAEEKAAKQAILQEEAEEMAAFTAYNMDRADQMDSLSDDIVEQDDELEALELEIGQYIDLLHKQKEAKEERRQILNPEKGKGYGIWKDMRKNKQKKDKKVSEQDQKIWEYIEDSFDEEATVQVKPKAIKKAPSPETMLNRMRQKPESDDDREQRITAMLDALDRRMALEAAARSKKTEEALIKKFGPAKRSINQEAENESEASGVQKKPSFDSQKRDYDPYDDGIIHGLMDDFQVIGELGNRVIEEDCGIKLAIEGDSNGKALAQRNNITAILEDTRDALLDFPHVIKTGGEVGPRARYHTEYRPQHPSIKEIIVLLDDDDEDDDDSQSKSQSSYSRGGVTTMDSSIGLNTNQTSGDSQRVLIRSEDLELNPKRREVGHSGMEPGGDRPSWAARAFCMANQVTESALGAVTTMDSNDFTNEERNDQDQAEMDDSSEKSNNSVEEGGEVPKAKKTEEEAKKGVVPVMPTSAPKSRLQISAFLEDDNEPSVPSAPHALAKREIHDLREIIPCWGQPIQGKLTSE